MVHQKAIVAILLSLTFVQKVSCQSGSGGIEAYGNSHVRIQRGMNLLDSSIA